MPWFDADTTILDVMVAIGSLATVLTVLFAGVGLRQASQARNLSSIIDIAHQLNHERARAYGAGVYKMEPVEFHVFQMTNLVEHASFIVNKGLVTSHAKAFLLEWLEAEIDQMDSQQSYREQFASLRPGELTELSKLRAKFHGQKHADEHWKKVISGRRWSNGRDVAKPVATDFAH